MAVVAVSSLSVFLLCESAPFYLPLNSSAVALPVAVCVCVCGEINHLLSIFPFHALVRGRALVFSSAAVVNFISPAN